MFHLLFGLRGRISRKTYWLFFLAVIVLAIAAAFLDGRRADEEEQGIPLFIALFSVAVIWPSIAVGVKRWHDRDKSGWWWLINLVPGVGPIWAVVECGFLAGSPSENRFGPPPSSAA